MGITAYMNWTDNQPVSSNSNSTSSTHKTKILGEVVDYNKVEVILDEGTHRDKNPILEYFVKKIKEIRQT